MKDTFTTNVDKMGSIATLFIITCGLPQTDDMVNTVNDCIISAVSSLFKEFQHKDFNPFVDEVPNEYLEATLAYLYSVNNAVEKAAEEIMAR